MKKRFRPIILALAIFLLIPTSAFASADEPSPNEPIIYEGTNNPVIFGAGEWDTILIWGSVRKMRIYNVKEIPK
nr:hypothetical protein [Heyndrickxia oleronia]